MTPRSAFPFVVATLAAFTLAACGGDDGPATPSAIQGVSGNNQVGTVDQALANPLSARVTDSGGNGLSGVRVDFQAAAGSGSLAAQEAARVVVTTDGDGVAEATWTLGTTAGAQSATATVLDQPPEATPLTFQFAATAEADVPAALSPTSGEDQIGAAGEDLGEPFVVRVLDQFGNGVPGATVDWAVSEGDGQLASAMSTSDEAGDASMTLTLGGGVGTNSVTAMQGPIGPVTFTALGLQTLDDAAGDEFSTSASNGLVPPDLVRIGAAVDAEDFVVVQLEFVNDVVINTTGGPNVMVGCFDFDVDQDPNTGIESVADLFRPTGNTGSTGMGVDYFIAMLADDTGQFDPTLFFLADSLFNIIGIFPPDFVGNKVTMAVPLSALGMDDGNINMAVAVGTVPEPTDIAPEDLSLMLGSMGGGSPELSVEGATRMIPATGKLPADIRSWMARRFNR